MRERAGIGCESDNSWLIEDKMQTSEDDHDPLDEVITLRDWLKEAVAGRN